MFGIKPEGYVTNWTRHTEYIIGMCGAIFAAALFGLYLSAVFFIPDIQTVGAVSFVILAYVVACLLRLTWVHFGPEYKGFGWVSAFIDLTFLSIIIAVLSLQNGEAAAALKASSHGFYYVIIALHAMRFKPLQVLAMGAVAIMCWSGFSIISVRSAQDMSFAYFTYISSPQLYISADIEKVFGILAFSILIAIGVSRAKALLTTAIETQISEVRIEEAEKAVKVKTEFLGTMSHELRTPMNGVLGMTEALRNTNLSAEQMKYVEVIERSGSALLSLIENILDYTELEMGDLNANSAEFNLKDKIDRIGLKLGPDARRKRLDFLIHIEPGSEHLIMGDEDRFAQVITNLVNNAIKFTDEGFVSLTISCKPIDHEHASLSVSVEDSGIGISKEKLDLIFERFAQSDASKTRRHGGTGLGLTIAQSIVRAKGGEITVESQLGEGAKFSFDLRVPYRKIDQKPQSLLRMREGLRRLKVLIVDDEPASADLLQKQLNDIGIMPQIVHDAQSACAAINAAYNAKNAYNFALIDYEMPQVNGLKLAQVIRSRPELDSMKIIVVSATDEDLAKKEFMRVGATAYLTKPYPVEILESAIFKAITADDRIAEPPISDVA